MNSHPSKVAANRFARSQPLKSESLQPKFLAKTRAPLLITLTVVSLTSAVGHRFYNQPSLVAGTIAPNTIVAPETASFTDAQKTEVNRQQVLATIVPVLKKDEKIAIQVEANLAAILDRIDKISSRLTVRPFLDQKIISGALQNDLARTPEAEWQAMQKALADSPNNNNFTTTNKSTLKIAGTTEEILIALGKYRDRVSDSEFNKTVATISRERQAYRKQKETAILAIYPNLDRAALNTFLDLTPTAWSQTKSSIEQVVDRMLDRGIPEGMPTELMRDAISGQVSTKVPKNRVVLVASLLDGILQPNLVRDETATMLRGKRIIAQMPQVMVSIKKGETIVTEGEIISREDFLLLDGLHLSQRGINWWGLGGTAGLIGLGTISLCLVRRRLKIRLRSRDAILLCFLSASAPILATFKIPYTNLPAVGLLTSSFYQPILAIAQVTLVGGLVALSEDNIDWHSLLAGTAGGLVAAACAWRMRSREGIAKLSLSIGVIQGGVYFTVKLLLGLGTGTIWYSLIPEALVYGFSGVAWTVVALGISPYLERLFDVVTPIRLAELSNPNLPLLKRLATEAPGTFQHTMFVASLGEAAARELNCNVELIRAGTLYHDIGKLHDPMGFIENQMGAPNKHEAIDDPWESAAIIKKHVSEGIEMAKKYGLPKAISDFIPQHQGTMLIAYFYYQAKDKQGDSQSKPVVEADFCYDGPIPQSREAGIMMLADCCEAALRSLKNATPEIALSMIHKIFKARWYERQLVDSGLRWEELPIIAEVFVKVWQQCNHQRIAYPKAALEPRKIEKEAENRQ